MPSASAPHGQAGEERRPEKPPHRVAQVHHEVSRFIRRFPRFVRRRRSRRRTMSSNGERPTAARALRSRARRGRLQRGTRRARSVARCRRAAVCSRKCLAHAPRRIAPESPRKGDEQRGVECVRRSRPARGQKTPLTGHVDEGFEPPRFAAGDLAALWRQRVVASPLVVFVGSRPFVELDDQPALRADG